jgi:hypothetical protein
MSLDKKHNLIDAGAEVIPPMGLFKVNDHVWAKACDMMIGDALLQFSDRDFGAVTNATTQFATLVLAISGATISVTSATLEATEPTEELTESTATLCLGSVDTDTNGVSTIERHRVGGVLTAAKSTGDALPSTAGKSQYMVLQLDGTLAPVWDYPRGHG